MKHNGEPWKSILSDIVSMGIEEGPVFFRMTANVMLQALQTTLEICTVNMYMLVGGLTFRQDCNDFAGFGEMG
jgi:hypothetical protein